VHAGRVRPRERGQGARGPAHAQRSAHGRGEPGPLGRCQLPAVPMIGEELADRAAAIGRTASRCLERALGRRAVRWMVPWTVRVQPLHPVTAPVAPRRNARCTPCRPGVQWLHPVGWVIRGLRCGVRRLRPVRMSVTAWPARRQVPALGTPVGAADARRDDARIAGRDDALGLQPVQAGAYCPLGQAGVADQRGDGRERARAIGPAWFASPTRTNSLN